MGNDVVVPPTGSSEAVWGYVPRRITFSKKSSPQDTNEYSTTSTSATTVATEKVNFGKPNAIIHIVRARFIRDARTSNSAYGCYSRILIEGNEYCYKVTYSDTYVTLDTESIVDLYVKADANGDVSVSVQLYSGNADYAVYIKNITIELWGIVVEPEQ